jgi:hypothetical protein
VTQRDRLLRGFVFTLCATTFAACGFGQSGTHLTHKQLKVLTVNAATAEDHRMLATYFHYQEMLFLSKAQQILDDYVNHRLCYPMATKTVTRSEVVTNFYRECLKKANENGILARMQDSQLAALGITPPVESRITVPVSSFKPSASPKMNSFLPAGPEK